MHFPHHQTFPNAVYNNLFRGKEERERRVINTLKMPETEITTTEQFQSYLPYFLLIISVRISEFDMFPHEKADPTIHVIVSKVQPDRTLQTLETLL